MGQEYIPLIDDFYELQATLAFFILLCKLKECGSKLSY